MHTVCVVTKEHGEARLHFNPDLSGNVLLSWGFSQVRAEIAIPAEVFGLLAAELLNEPRPLASSSRT